MYDQLPTNDKEADERLLTMLKGYVKEDGMPINTAERIIREQSRNFDNFEKAWNQFKQSLKQRRVCQVK